MGGETWDVDNDGDSRRFDAPLVVWIRGPSGAAYQSDPSATLPADLTATVGPTTATIGGAQMRLVGGPLATAHGTGWLTIAQSTSEVTGAANTIAVAVLLTAPLVLVVVFAGALLVGRRVAGPIEQARVAQLAFTADASHELRTPLTVIEAETSLALQVARDPDEYRQTLSRVQDEAKLLRGLVDDLLWLARFDSTPTPPASEPIDVGALATTTVQRFRAIGNQRGMTLTARVIGSTSPVISAPPEWISRLLSVLIDNAIQHSPDESSVLVVVGSIGGRVEIAVEDAGPGIPAEQRSLIFNRFHQAGITREGSGLGLAIADAIVRATAGHWQVGESPAAGARMAVSWHRSPSHAFDNPSVEQANGRAAEHVNMPADEVTQPASTARNPHS